MAYVTNRRVEFRDTDAAGVMHFSGFLVWMEEVEHEALRSVGLSVLSHSSDGSLSWPRASVSCDFVSPVRFEDVVDIQVRVERLGEKSVTYAFEMRHGANQVATGRMTAVCCRLSPGAMTSVTIPPDVRRKLELLISE
jgi:4-hydroxybenzoyl-CoA thioesterase/acyl-CoA thioester hydrolase